MSNIIPHAQKHTKSAIIMLFVLIATGLFTCNPVYENDGIPSYIHIQQIGLTTTANQGTASHKITDAWVYINNELIGAFELPATFPVLKSGIHEVTLYAGIKINGISATRAPYPFFNPIFTTIELIQGEITEITDTITTYKSTANFVWMEDFNGASLTIDSTVNSHAGLQRTTDPNLRFSYRNENNSASGMAVLSGEKLLFECASINEYSLPKGDFPVFFEMNYRNESLVTVGLFAISGNQISQQSVLVLNPSDEWNKIYVNLTPTVSRNVNADKFKVFIGFLKPTEMDTVKVYFDNLKLIH